MTQQSIEKSPHNICLLAMELPVGDTCQWPGTTYSGHGKEAILNPCGDETVGKGMFCDPDHRHCYVADVCERHKGTAPWYEEDEGAWHL